MSRAILAAVFLAVGVRTDAAEDQGLQEALRRHIELLDVGVELVAGGERIHAAHSLRDFYERRLFKPAWLDGRRIVTGARELVDAIRDAASDGLRSSDYHRTAIESLITPGGRTTTAGAELDLELLLTDAFLLLASHRLAGRLDPERIQPEWRAVRRGADLATVLSRALEAGRLRQALDELLPPQPGYAKLREALGRHRALASRGGWPLVADGPPLRLGDEGPRVRTLAMRLRASGAFPEGTAAGMSGFDERLERAVRAFQARHGLDADGVVGPKTVAALNVPVERRIRQLVVNLERWRWLPQDLGERHVLVNIAGFYLEAVDSDIVELDMRVIVGRNYRSTPVFSDTMTYLVLNPSWEVPPRLATEDILPMVQQDPDYLAANGFTVLSGWGPDARAVDPDSVDWRRVAPQSFPYRLRQKPGARNALGRIKFMFPNAFNVYLHDTPSRELFVRSERAFSSGCIRVERAIDLAAWVLEGQRGWDRATIVKALERGQETTVRLPRPVAVHLLYWTAWVDRQGQLNFRNDIYGRDRRVEEALAEPLSRVEGEGA